MICHGPTMVSDTPSQLKSLLSQVKSSVWIGAVSFEDRCVGSLASLCHHGLHVTSVVILNYPTQAHPYVEDQGRRKKNKEILTGLASVVGIEGIRDLGLDPYAFQSLQDMVEETIIRPGVDLAIFDITCMTKIHAIALAAMLSQVPRSFKWCVAYSTPDNYSDPVNAYRTPGWRDIILAPLAETAVLFNEARGRGVIIPGHEADRLIVGLAELEPSGGLILIPDTPRRPDLRLLCERNNQKVIRQLTRMRSSDWKKKAVGVLDLDSLKYYVGLEIRMAMKYNAPVILFPYGPKPLLFFTSIQLCSEYPEASWFVYPIPSAYDANYSEGVERTTWLVPK